MRKVAFFTFVLTAFSVGFMGFAQDASRPKRLLLIDSQTAEPYVTVRESLLARLAELGYSPEAGTLETRLYSMGNSPDFIRRIEAQEGSRLGSWDLIVPIGTIATMAVYKDWADAPTRFLFMAVTDPVGIGAVGAIGSPPEGNFTGVAYPVPVEARLRFIRSAFPNATRIGYVWGDMPQSRSYNQWLEEALKKPEFSGLTLVSRKARFVSGEFGTRRMCIESAELAAGIDAEVDLFMAPNDQMGTEPEYARLLSQAVTKPVVGIADDQVSLAVGAVAAIFPDLVAMGRQGADMAAAYFSGAPFASLLPEATAYDVVFSREVADRIGLRIPPQYRDKVR